MSNSNNTGLDDNKLWDMAGRPGPISPEDVGTGINNNYLTEGLDFSQVTIRSK